MKIIDIYTHGNDTLFIDGNSLVSWCESNMGLEYDAMQFVDDEISRHFHEECAFRFKGLSYDRKDTADPSEKPNRYKITIQPMGKKPYTEIVYAYSKVEAMGFTLEHIINTFSSDDVDISDIYSIRDCVECHTTTKEDNTEIAERYINKAWGEFLERNGIESGDIEPMISLELDEIAERIADLMQTNADFFGYL